MQQEEGEVEEVEKEEDEEEEEEAGEEEGTEKKENLVTDVDLSSNASEHEKDGRMPRGCCRRENENAILKNLSTVAREKSYCRRAHL